MNLKAFAFFFLLFLTPLLLAQPEGPIAVPALPQPAAVEKNGDLLALPPFLGKQSDVVTPKEKEKQKQPQMPVNVSFSLSKVFWSFLIIALAYLMIRFIGRLLEALSEKWQAQRLSIKAAIPLVRICSWLLCGYVVIEGVIAPPVESLLAFGASVGLALGFASQDILKNIFGGLLILMDRPFQVGDKIEADKYYGEVVHIGLRTVRVVTPDDSMVSIPNSLIVSQSVMNSNSGEANCQVVAEIFLPFGVDFHLVKHLARQAAEVSQYVYLGKPTSVVIKNEVHQGVSLIKVRIKAYVHDLRQEFAFSTEMTEIFISEMIKAGGLPAAWLGMGALPRATGL